MGRPYNRKYGGKQDANQKPIVAALEQAGCACRVTSSVGGGFVDVVVWSPFTRSTHLVEVKPDAKAKLTKDEQTFHDRWPGPIDIVRSIDEALIAVGAQKPAESIKKRDTPENAAYWDFVEQTTREVEEGRR